MSDAEEELISDLRKRTRTTRTPQSRSAKRQRRNDNEMILRSASESEEPVVWIKTSTTEFDESYNVKSSLGKGVYGTVYEMYSKHDKRLVAVKLQVEENQAQATNEVLAMKRLQSGDAPEKHNFAVYNHHFVVTVYREDATSNKAGGIFNDYALSLERNEHQSLYVIVTELVGNAQTLYALDTSGTLPEFVRGVRLLKMYRQLLRALSYMHSKRIYHRDLRSPNTMVRIDGSHQAVLLDFGIACSTDDTQPTENTFVCGYDPDDEVSFLDREYKSYSDDELAAIDVMQLTKTFFQLKTVREKQMYSDTRVILGAVLAKAEFRVSDDGRILLLDAPKGLTAQKVIRFTEEMHKALKVPF